MGFAGWLCAEHDGQPGADWETDDQHPAPQPFASLMLTGLASWSAARCKATEPTFRLYQCTERWGIIRQDLDIGLEGEDAETRPTQRIRLWMRGAGSQETESSIGCHEHKRTEVVNTVGVADGLCAVADGSGFDGS